MQKKSEVKSCQIDGLMSLGSSLRQFKNFQFSPVFTRMPHLKLSTSLPHSTQAHSLRISLILSASLSRSHLTHAFEIFFFLIIHLAFELWFFFFFIIILSASEISILPSPSELCSLLLSFIR